MFKYRYTFLLVGLLMIKNILGLNHSSNDHVCKINLSQYEDFGPLIFSKQNNYFDFARPKLENGTRTVTVQNGERIIFSCSGVDFLYNISDTTAISSQCVDTRFMYRNISISLDKFKCNGKVKSSLVSTEEECGDDGETIEIGFDVDLRQNSIPHRKTLIEVCFNREKGITYYTRHYLLGDGLEASERTNFRPGFRIGLSNIFSFSPNSAYTRTEQNKTLSRLLGEKLSQKIFNKSFLARGHLSPDADFFIPSAQSATYYYINTAPQWQRFNSGTWRLLEKLVKQFAMSTNLDYLVMTGTHGVQHIHDKNNNLVSLYLHGSNSDNDKGSKLPVPQYFWKILYEPRSKQGIVFVGMNSHDKNENVNWPCVDICNQSHWGSRSWNNSIICCDILDLQHDFTKYPTLPVTGVLEGNKLLY